MSEYIEREALKKAFAKQCAGECDVCGQNGDFGCSLVACAPSADVAPVIHGKWIDYKRSYIIGYDGVDEYKCSNCGCRRSVKSKYCKECGAKMDVLEGSENDG